MNNNNYQTIDIEEENEKNLHNGESRKSKKYKNNKRDPSETNIIKQFFINPQNKSIYETVMVKDKPDLYTAIKGQFNLFNEEMV